VVPTHPLEAIIMVEETYRQLVKLVADAESDVQKAAGGNKAAGTRVRKSMQDIKKIANDLRAKILESRDTPDA
jgi:hypothetical protein